jgi:hypothetical protein
LVALTTKIGERSYVSALPHTGITNELKERLAWLEPLALASGRRAAVGHGMKPGFECVLTR